MFGLELIKDLSEIQRERLIRMLRMYQIHGGIQIYIQRIVGNDILVQVDTEHHLNLAQLNKRVEAAFKDGLPPHYRLVIRP